MTTFAQPLLLWAAAATSAGPSITDWITAIATAVTGAVAVLAAWYAKGQLAEATRARAQTRDLERERSQPNVSMYMEPSAASAALFDVVIKNFGATAARDVRPTVAPALTRSGTPASPVAIPRSIPFLAPGQEWRTLWDNGLTRKDSDLPDRHEGVLTYRGIDNALLTTNVLLDWSTYKTRRWVVIKTVHDAAKSLDSIDNTLKTFREGSTGVSVWTREGEAKDDAERLDYERAIRDAEGDSQ